MANGILQPPRTFRLSADFSFPEDVRSDAELTAFLLTNLSSTLALGYFGVGANVARIPHVEQRRTQ